MDTGTNLTPSNTMDNSIGQVVPFNDPYQEPTDLITAQAGGGQEGQKTPDDVFSADSKFKPPYDGSHGFDPKRDNKGRYRRKLVVPLKKDAESIEVWEMIQQNLNNPDAVREFYRVLVGDPDDFTGDDMALVVAEAYQQNDNSQEFVDWVHKELFSAEEPVVQEPDWIPAGDGRALGQQNLDINLSPLHAEGNLKDYNPITLVVLGVIGGIGIALGAQSLVK